MSGFSPRTVIALIKAFQFNTHAALETMALEFGLDDVLGGEGIEKRETRAIRHLINNPGLQGPDGGPLVLELAERAIADRCQRPWGDSLDPTEEVPDLVYALKQDGFVVVDHRLRRMLPEAVPISDAQDEITRLLDEHSFETAKGHLDQALAAHARGDWAASNSQLRSFVEELFDQIADRLSGGDTSRLPNSHSRREWLASSDPPFLDPELNEWEIGRSGGFVQGLWRRLHPDGSHPGLSDEADASFRLHLVLLIGEHFMRRFDRRVRP